MRLPHLFLSFAAFTAFTSSSFAADLTGLWGQKNDSAETVTLSRRLPPVAKRNGRTVRFEPTVAGNSIPLDVVNILKEKIRNFLLQGKEGGIQLVDDHGDTILKTLISGYEPKVTRPNKREIGNKTQTISTLIGNIEASVQVLDPNGEPLDAAIVKHHLEEDYVVAQQDEKVSNVTDKGVSLLKKITDARKVVAGSSASTGPRLPTDLEWSTRLVEGLAARVANRIVPVNEDFVIVLPHDKALSQARDLVKSRRWGDAQENLEKMQPLKGGDDAYRLYVLGISYEGLAYQSADETSKAPELLNKASEYYEQAAKLKPSERQFLLQQIRVRDSLDHYLSIQHYMSSRKPGGDPKPAEPKVTVGGPKPAEPPAVAPVKTPTPISPAPTPGLDDPSTKGGDNNAMLITMAASGIPENIMLTFVRESKKPSFDSSGMGLIQLQNGKVSPKVIEAVQQKMQADKADPSAVKPPPARRAAPPKSTPPKATPPAGKVP